MKNSWSLAAVWIAWIFIVLLAFFFYPKWKQGANERTIGYDVAGYYEYLPAIFIYHDLAHLQFQDSVFAKYQLGTNFPNYTAPNGNKVLKYPVGAAIMYLPWFAFAHAYALATNLAADGYSRPYQTFLSYGCLIYVLTGLWFARKILLQYFSDKVTAITVLLLVLATNYLNYAAIDHAMTHSLLFTLFTILIYFTIRFYKNPALQYAGIIGILTGLAVITRPSEIVICLIPLLWGIGSTADLKQRWQFVAAHAIKFGFAIFCNAIIIAIQLFYWRFASGHFLEYSYTDQGFNFSHPFLYKVLFTFRKGWFVYTPFMLLIVPGFVWLYKNNRNIFWAIFLFFCFTLWIVSSWEIWWYGGSLGQRALVQSYAVLIFPIAAFINHMRNTNWFWKWTVIIFIAYAIMINIFFTWQAHAPGNMYESENMNRDYFWKSFLKTEIPPSDRKFLDNVDEYTGKSKTTQTIAEQLFETDTIAIAEDNIIRGNHARIINAANPFYSMVIPAEQLSGFTWLRISAMVYMEQREYDIWKADQLAVWFKQGDERVKTNFIRIQRIADSGNWAEVYFDVHIPDVPFDNMELAVIHLGSNYTLLIDKLMVTAMD